jgi:hypothetical protein
LVSAFWGDLENRDQRIHSMALVISPSFDPVAIPVVRLVAEDAQWRTSCEREMPSMPWYIVIDTNDLVPECIWLVMVSGDVRFNSRLKGRTS